MPRPSFLGPTGLALAACVAIAASAAAKAPPRSKAQAVPARSLLEVQILSIDTPHSNIEFTVPWMALARVRGTFSDFSGCVAFDSTDLTRSTVTVIVRTASISTHNDLRDHDLKGAGFFDAEKFPTAVLTSRSIEKTATGYLMHASLTLKDVTRDLDVPFVFLGRNDGLDHEAMRLGFEGRATLKRTDYGVVGPANFNRLLEAGERMIGENVELDLSVSTLQPNLDKSRARAADSLLARIDSLGLSTVAEEYRGMRSGGAIDSLRPVREGALNELGYHLLQRGRSADAIRWFELEAETYPRSAFAQVGLGQAYATAGDRDRSIASCEKALQLRPDAVRAIEMLRHLRPA